MPAPTSVLATVSIDLSRADRHLRHIAFSVDTRAVRAIRDDAKASRAIGLRSTARTVRVYSDLASTREGHND